MNVNTNIYNIHSLLSDHTIVSSFPIQGVFLSYLKDYPKIF